MEVLGPIQVNYDHFVNFLFLSNIFEKCNLVCVGELGRMQGNVRLRVDTDIVPKILTVRRVALVMKKRSGAIQICLDPQSPNFTLNRERHRYCFLTMPKVSHILNIP